MYYVFQNFQISTLIKNYVNHFMDFVNTFVKTKPYFLFEKALKYAIIPLYFVY